VLFINREKELSFLEQEYQSDGASFVVIYGRRRIGKTTLIKEFLINKPAVYFLATQEAISQNLEVLTDLIADFTDNSLLKNSKGHSWDVIIREFANYKEDKKKILVIDEFQYLEMSQKGFASVFQRIWDEILQNKNVMIVLCGSYISMMKS
jgi:AAA+ ATPase superfamily predicted ATPase